MSMYCNSKFERGGMRSGRLPVFFAVFLALGLSACFGSIDNERDQDQEEPENIAERDSGIRFMHVGAEGDTVHIYFDDERVGSNIGYTNASGYLNSFPDGDDLAGEIEVRLVERTDEETESPNTLASQFIEFDEDTRLTAFIQGQGEDLSMRLVDEHFEGETSASTVLRLSHFADSSGNVDIYVGDSGDEGIEGMSPWYEDVEPGSVMDYQSVAGEDALRIRVTPPGEDNILFDSGESTGGGVLYFHQGDRIHLALLSMSSDNYQSIRGFSRLAGQALIQSRERGNATDSLGDARSRVQLLHAVGDGEAVNVDVDDRPVAEDLTFEGAADPFFVTGGERVFQLYDSGSGANVEVSEPGVDFGSRNDYALVLLGSWEAGELQWAQGRVGSASQSIDDDEVRVYTHAVNGYYGYDEEVDLVINDVIPGGGFELAYGEYEVFGQSMPIEDGNNWIRFYKAGTYGVSDELIAEKEVSLVPGESYTAVLTGNAGTGEEPAIVVIRHWIFDD